MRRTTGAALIRDGTSRPDSSPSISERSHSLFDWMVNGKSRRGAATEPRLRANSARQRRTRPVLVDAGHIAPEREAVRPKLAAAGMDPSDTHHCPR